jgi:CheY-like chemotaxis protein
MHNHKDVTLLLVEDDEVDAMTVRRGLSKHRIKNNLVRAKNGAEALDIMASGGVRSPYIVLLDLQMPKMNGLEFLKHIRSNDKLKEAVVFVLTTSKDEQDILKSYTFNVAGYFVKDDVGSGFCKAIEMLDEYWKTVQLPCSIA